MTYKVIFKLWILGSMSRGIKGKTLARVLTAFSNRSERTLKNTKYEYKLSTCDDSTPGLSDTMSNKETKLFCNIADSPFGILKVG